MTEEHIARRTLFRTLMQVPHRNYDPMVEALRTALNEDPDFIARACVHICTGGSNIRDQQDAAIITLLQSPHHFEYRQSGRALLLGSDVFHIEPSVLSGLPPFRILRIDRYIRSSDRKTPRQMRTLMMNWARMLEASPARFDGVAVRQRKALKSVYKHYHIPPSERAQAILFDDSPPADSKLAILKIIANTKDVREQAKLVIEHKIPYVVATSVLPKVTPIVAVALIEAMTPTEALNSRRWVEQSGILQFAEVKEVFVAKVGKATKSVASAQHRKSAQGADQDVQAAIEQATETAVKESSRINRDTLLMVDVSGSMSSAIEAAQKFGGRIGPLVDAELRTVVFREYGQMLTIEQNTLAGFQKAFRGLRAGGGTNMEQGYLTATEDGWTPEQIVLISDGGERRGSLSTKLSGMVDPPHTVLICVPGADPDFLSPRMIDAGLGIDKFEVSGEDYYIYDQAAAVLGGPPAISVVQRIMQTPLPVIVGVK